MIQRALTYGGKGLGKVRALWGEGREVEAQSSMGMQVWEKTAKRED